MTDFASIGIEMDSRPVVEGTKALDALGEASARVEQKIRVSNGQMSDTAKIMRAQADQAKAAAQANAVLGGSTSALTAGQAQLIERFREQAATVGMSRSQMMAYQAAQMGVTEQTREAVAAVKAHEDALRAASQAKADAVKSTNILTDALKLLAAGYAALKVGEIIKDSAMQAARFETLGVVMGVVGKTAGYTKVQMDTASEAIAAQGITMLESRNSAIKLVQAHVDLTNASKLARIAQDAAVIGNINSSEAFERLVNGVSRGNVLILRNIGINVNLQSAYQQMADSLGKSTKELTENERVQARLNAVMERGSDIAGTYEASMGTAGKQILSMQRYVSDLKTVFGETFNEVLTVAVMGLTSGLKDANGEVSQLAKNNQLTEWGHGLATIFVGIADAVGNAYTAVQKFDAFARHKDAQKAINEDFDAQSKKNFSEGSLLDLGGVRSRGQRIEAMRQSAIAQENADYEAQQANLSGHFDRFGKAYKEFSDARIAKQKADAAERLKVDQDYATRAQALLIANAGKSIEIQQAAQAKLAKEVYIGTPNFRDTEGREPKDKIDRADSARLQNKLARIQEESAIDKEYANYEMQLDDMRHKAGELGDEQYVKNRKESLQTIFISEQAMYDKELAALRAHHNSTEEEREKNQKAIDDILGKQNAAQTKYSHDTFAADEAERLRQKAVEMASQDASNKYISGLNAEAEKLEQSNGAHERSRSAIERETVARLDSAIVLQEQVVAKQASSDASQKEIDQGKLVLKFLQDMRDARARIATAAATQESDLFSKKAADQAIQDWQRAGASIADSLSNAFGTGGKAIGQMFKAYAEGVAGQLRAQKELAAAKKLSDDNPEKIAAISRAQSDGAQAQLKSYGDMAGAAQSYFDKGSAGYQAMGAAARVMHAAEVALSLVKGVNAVLTQGEGDPYSAFARMAAMAAVVTGLGVALTSGGGGGVSAADRQKAQGAGSVLGDGDAKSESIKRALDAVEKNTYQGLAINSSMLATLRSIDTNIGSFASQLVRTTDITNPDVALKGGVSGSNMGSVALATAGFAAGSMVTLVGSVLGPVGALVGAAVSRIPAVQKLMTSIFGGKQSVSDSGFGMDSASLASILGSGAHAYQYADITTSGGWFRSDKHSEQSNPLGDAANQQFTAIIESLAGSVKSAGELLGLSGDDFTAKLNSFVVDIGNVSLKDLKGDDLQKAIESVFSKLGDQMAQFAVGGLSQFQQVGEGYLETLARIASEYQSIDVVFQSFGKTFGEMGLASIGARDRLVQLAGGLDKFTSQGEYFLSNFFSEKEQAAALKARVQPALDQFGLQASGEGAMRALRDFVVCLDTTTEAGAQAYTTLMQYAPAVKQIADAEKGVLDERKGLQDQLDELTMSSTQLLAKQRAALDASNVALFDQIQGIKAQTAATEAAAAAIQAAKDSASALLGGVDSAYSVLQNVVGREKAAVQTSVDVHSAAVSKLQSLSQALHSTLDSIQSPEQKLFARASAQAEIHADLAITRAGGALSDAQIESLKKALGAVNQDAAGQFGSYQDYLRDLYQTQNDISKLGDITDDSLSVEQKALDAAKEQLKSLDQVLLNGQQQVDELKGINTNGLTLAQAMDGLTKAILAAKDNPIVGATGAINGAYQQYLGRAPDAQGLQWWQNAAAGGAPVSQIVDGIKGSTEASLNSLYQSVLGRAPDAEGLSFWMKAYGPTMDEAEQADWMKAAQGSDEYKKLHPFAVGTNFVPETMPALVHQGERIIPAADNRALMNRLSSPSGNSDALASAVDRLNATVERQNAIIDAQGKTIERVRFEAKRQADFIERLTNGGQYMPTKAVS